MINESTIKRRPDKADGWDCWGVLAFVFGLVFVQGIIYVTKVGNLYVDIVYPLAVFVLCINLVLRPTSTIRSIELCFHRGMLPFLVVVVLSVFLAMGSTLTHIGVDITSCVNGFVVLLFSLAIYFAVISLRDRVHQFISAIFVGLLVNIAISIAQYVAFQSGTAFTLYDLFPQPAFYISVPWGSGGAWAQNIQYLVYSYRAQGLWLEVSYFVGAATVVFILAMGCLRLSGTFKAAVFVTLLFLFAMSNTGNLVLYVAFVFVAYLLLRLGRGRTLGFASKRRSSAEWLAVLCVLAVLVGIFVYALSNTDDLLRTLDLENLLKGLAGGLESSNITSADNQQRFQYMQNALSEFFRYPWGGGYNMAPSLTFYDYGTNTTFSYALTLLVELGPIGLVAYGYFVFSMVVRLFGDSLSCSLSGVSIAVALVAYLAFQIGNGVGLTPLAWCLFALGSIEIANRKGDSNEHHIEC